MKDLVAHIARELVDKPEAVSVAEVAEIEGNRTCVLELKVAKERMAAYSRAKYPPVNLFPGTAPR